MAARSLNKVQLIGNLTRDPELRYTPQGTAVSTFGLATNRTWTTESNEKKEDVEFHRIVAWNKLAELCSQLLFKGRKVFVEGRLQTREWTGKDGVQRQTTEIVVADMIILDSKRAPGGEGVEGQVPQGQDSVSEVSEVSQEKKDLKKETVAKDEEKKIEVKKEEPESDEVKPEDIPF